jgi:hypothetical protein
LLLLLGTIQSKTYLPVGQCHLALGLTFVSMGQRHTERLHPKPPDLGHNEYLPSAFLCAGVRFWVVKDRLVWASATCVADLQSPRSNLQLHHMTFHRLTVVRGRMSLLNASVVQPPPPFIEAGFQTVGNHGPKNSPSQVPFSPTTSKPKRHHNSPLTRATSTGHAAVKTNL